LSFYHSWLAFGKSGKHPIFFTRPRPLKDDRFQIIQNGRLSQSNKQQKKASFNVLFMSTSLM